MIDGQTTLADVGDTTWTRAMLPSLPFHVVDPGPDPDADAGDDHADPGPGQLGLDGHEWGHGAKAVQGFPKGSSLDCGHVTRGHDYAHLYDDQWVCLDCTVAIHCPTCSTAGRNVLVEVPS